MCGQEGIPVPLLMLGVFRYLDQGIMFDDLEEYTALAQKLIGSVLCFSGCVVGGYV